MMVGEWFERPDAVITAARRVVQVQAERCRRRHYIVPFFALAELSVAVADLDDEQLPGLGLWIGE